MPRTQLFLLVDKLRSMQPGFKPSDREEVSINQQEDMPKKQAALDKGVGTSVRTCESEGKQHLGQKGHSQHL